MTEDVIASEAKQSGALSDNFMDCFVATARRLQRASKTSPYGFSQRRLDD
jgi:hypothetical protein